MNPIVLFPANPTNYYTEFVQVLLWLLQTKFLVYDLSSPFRTFMFCTKYGKFVFQNLLFDQFYYLYNTGTCKNITLLCGARMQV